MANQEGNSTGTDFTEATSGTANTTESTGGTGTAGERGWSALKAFMLGNKYDAALWLLRIYVAVCTFFYLIPVLGFKVSYDCFKRVLLGSATISALRLHQRLPRFQFSRQYFMQVIQEDAFHYLMYSVMFLLSQPATLVLVPIVVFSILHTAAYTRKVIEVLGTQNALLVRLRGLVSKVEDRQSQQNLLQFIASSEILMMPVTILMLFTGQASLLVPFFYYRFLQLRYSSRRNPYSRLMFNQMRLGIERVAANPRCPSIGRRILQTFVGLVSRLSPGIASTTA